MDETLELLMEQIEQRRMQIIESLGDGGPRDFAEYRYTFGMVRGLLTAQSLIADLAKKMEHYDD